MIDEHAGAATNVVSCPIPVEDEVALTGPHLELILASKQFCRSKRLSAFLSYLVQKRTAGESEAISEYGIAVDVYKRRADFDPALDNIVRSEARRLRQRLDEYYESEGKRSAIRIVIPSRSYVPEFRAKPAGFKGFREYLGNSLTHNVWRGVHVSLSLAVVLGVVYVLFLQRGDSFPDYNAYAAGAPTRLTVELLETIGSETDDEALAYVVSYSLAQVLSQVQGLHVGGSAQPPHDSRAVEHRASNTDYVLGGSVRRLDQDGVYHVSLFLLRRGDARLMWTENIVGKWDQILDRRELVAKTVAEKLNLRFDYANTPPAVRMTNNLVAYRAFLAGQVSNSKYVTNWELPRLDEAEAMLTRAIELDPNFDEAYVELGYLKLISIYPPPAADKAVELSNEAEKALKQALFLNPRNATALSLMGWLKAIRGQPREGIQLSQRAIETDRTNPLHFRILAKNYISLGFYEAAMAQVEQALAIDPTEPITQLNEHFILLLMGRTAEAIELANANAKKSPRDCQFIFTKAKAHLIDHNFPLVKRFALEALACESPEGPSRPTFEAALAIAEAAEGDNRRLLEVIARYRAKGDFASDIFLLACAYSGDAELTTARIRSSSFNNNYRWLVTAPLPAEIVRSPAIRELALELYRKWELDLAEIGGELPTPPPVLPTPEQWFSQPRPDSPKSVS
jgi:tetratricopeptide (TPR) repeat protein